MSEYQHTTLAMVFTVTADDRENRLVRIKGKRKWYAPWLRYPDRWYDPVEAMEIGIADRRREMLDGVMGRGW